ncbi:hypothetical protein EPUL_006544, partial [Erysiphe pulchra]
MSGANESNPPATPDIQNLSYEEFTGSAYVEAPKQPNQTMSVMLGISREIKGKELHGSDKKVTLESFLNIGDVKKRARPIHIEDLLNKEEQDPKLRKRNRRSSEKKVIRHLREIVGRQGKGPINYQRLAEDIKVEVSLMDLFQMSPDLSKAFRALSTRINKKLEKRKDFTSKRLNISTDRVDGMRNIYDSESLLSRVRTSFGSVDQKAFRVPATIKSRKDGKIVNVSLPASMTQADQGSDMIIVTVGFLKKLGLSAKRLSERGFEGLTMNVADGTSAELTHYAEFEIGVLGIWRRIEAFVRPFNEKNIHEVHLLLGMPWLHAVDAKIRIRESIIETGDTQRGEKVVKVEGPQFIESELHKLVLCPKEDIKSQPVEFHEASSEDSDESLYDSDSDDSLSDAESEGLKDMDPSK